MGRRRTATWIVCAWLAALAGCVDLGFIDLRFQPNVNRQDTGEVGLRRISSAAEWIEFFRDQIVARSDQPSRGGIEDDGLFFFETTIALGAPDSGGPAGQADPIFDGAFDADGASPESFTTTNLQEFGVDESDVVKTDGEYFYMLVGSELRIVKAYPPEELTEVASLELNGSPYSNATLYLRGERVIAISQPAQVFFADVLILEEPLRGDVGDARDDSSQAEPSSLSPLQAIELFGLYYDHQKTVVTIVDVQDPGEPQVEVEWTFDGFYVDSRMVDGVLHLIINQAPNIPFELNPAAITVEDIAKFIPTYDTSYADGSEDSGLLVMWDDFYRPIDPDGHNITTVVSLDTDDLTKKFSSVAVMADPGTIYASTAALYLTDPVFDYFGEYRETLDIHKFALAKGGAEYVASGSVEGRLLNQFSLGEYEDHLRVATTTGRPWAWDQQTSKNHIFVLAQNGDSLEVTGSIQDLAPGEQIQSARFLQERCFLVTFRQVDPLFTIDLSNPFAPVVRGKLKVPGFSEYIHLLDDDHLLTLGKAANDEGVVLGLQLSIFDVRDFGDPQLVASRTIGGPGTYSEAEHNHKAFTFYRQENLLAIPVDLYSKQWDYEFSGLQIYHVTPEDGISLRGEISTSSDTGMGYPTYFGWTRGIFIEDLIYAVTEVGVQSASIDEPGEIIGSVVIEGSAHTSRPGLVEPAFDAPVDEAGTTTTVSEPAQ